jgi:hypothetical protein
MKTNKQNKDMEEVKKRYCKKCQKEVNPIKRAKTAGKRVANFFGFVLGVGPVYTYPKKCPYCGKVLRTKTQKICIIIFISFIVISGIIYYFKKFPSP